MTSLVLANPQLIRLELIKYRTLGPIDLKLDIDNRIDFDRLHFLFVKSRMHSSYL